MFIFPKALPMFKPNYWKGNTLSYPKWIQVGGGYTVLLLENIIRHLFSMDNPSYPFFEFPNSIHAKTPREQEFLNLIDDIIVAPIPNIQPSQLFFLNAKICGHF